MTTLKYPGLQKYDEKIKEWVANVTSPMVHKSGNENISGIKNFSESPLVPTPAATDNSTKTVNSEWVRSIFSSVGGFSFGSDGKVYVDFSQMDPAIMRAVVTAMVLPGGGLASDEDTGNLYVDFDEMDPDIMREVVLSMVQPGSGLAVDDTTGQLYVDFSLMPTDKFEDLLKSIHVPIWIGENGVGTEFYVNAVTGTDTQAEGQGKSASKPWASIAYATQTICQNYNINSRTVYIEVAPGLYEGSVALPMQQRTTGGIVIRPVPGSTGTVTIKHTVTGTASVVAHSGGEWELRDVDLSLVLGRNAGNSTAYPKLLYSTDATGSITITHCNLSFTDNSDSSDAGYNVRLIDSDGGRIIVQNRAVNVEGVADPTQYDVSWSGEKINVGKISWLFLDSGGTITMWRSGAAGRTASRGFGYNVSGSYSIFCEALGGGSYRNAGNGELAFWNPVNSPAGKRYEVKSGGHVSTDAANLGAVESYFPGDVAGTIEVGTYSWISPHEDYYAPNILFDPTPVYSVTLAEDVTASSASPYEIEMPEGIRNAYARIYAPAAASAATGRLTAYYNSVARGCNIANMLSTSDRYSACLIRDVDGIVFVLGGSGSSGSATNVTMLMMDVAHDPVFTGGEALTKLTLYTGNDVLPAGTTITVYAAKEV